MGRREVVGEKTWDGSAWGFGVETEDAEGERLGLKAIGHKNKNQYWRKQDQYLIVLTISRDGAKIIVGIDNERGDLH